MLTRRLGAGRAVVRFAWQAAAALGALIGMLPGFWSWRTTDPGYVGTFSTRQAAVSPTPSIPAGY